MERNVNNAGDHKDSGKDDLELDRKFELVVAVDFVGSSEPNKTCHKANEDSASGNKNRVVVST